MMWRTHALFSITSLWLLTPLPPEWLSYDYGTLAAVAAFGALLPDLDAADAKIIHLGIGRVKPFLLPAQIVSRTNQHRGLLHSLAGVAMAAVMFLPLAYWLGWLPVVALLLGYTSHLVADAATKSGIRLLYPRHQRFYLLPKRWLITTGSQAEEMFLPFLTFIVFMLLLCQPPFP